MVYVVIFSTERELLCRVSPKENWLHPLTQIFSITSVLKQVQRFCLKLFLPFCCLV